jgi:hypothetical protein
MLPRPPARFSGRFLLEALTHIRLSDPGSW